MFEVANKVVENAFKQSNDTIPHDFTGYFLYEYINIIYSFRLN